MKDALTVESVVAEGLCHSCGTCVAVCQIDAVSMKEMPGGLLEAYIDKPKCTNCGSCYKVCPGRHLDERGMPRGFEPPKGPVLAVFTAKATCHQVFQNAQSGGVATALLLHLIQLGKIEGALVSEMPRNGSLRPRAIFARTEEQILRAQGSKYCPIPLNEGLRRFSGSSFAYVGLPCHLHGLQNMKVSVPNQAVTPHVTLGLFCDRVLAFTAMDYLIEKAGLCREEVVDFRFKDKSLGGWPGNIGIYSMDGSIGSLSGDHRIACKEYFTPIRCRLCFDKLNILADLSLGDAWGVQEDKKGTSVIIVRSQRGMDVVASAKDAGVLELQETCINAVAEGQGAHARFRNWSDYMNTWADMGHSTPEYSIRAITERIPQHPDYQRIRRHLISSLYLRTSKSHSEVLHRAKRSIMFQRLKTKLNAKRISRKIKNYMNIFGE